YPTANDLIWDHPHRNTTHPDVARENPIVNRYFFDPSTEHFFVKDDVHPYVQKRPFTWIRGYQVGGRSLMWARMVQRWADFDFKSNLEDGNGTDWPIRYEDLAPWYSHVEKFAGVSGNRDGLRQIPDGEFLPALGDMNCVEKYFKQFVESNYPERNVVISRSANVSQPHNGRVCLRRNLCRRGCPYGGYFSANATTIPAAEATGNMTLRPHSVVHSIIYDENKGKAVGVRVIDANTKETYEYFSDIIFLNAGSLNSLLIMMNSTSNRFPKGLGNDSEVLGHYIMHHNYRSGAAAEVEGYTDKYYAGYRPGNSYIPRFRNYGQDKQNNFLRGYAYNFQAGRSAGNLKPTDEPIGAAFKEKFTELGPWTVRAGGMGEILPNYNNKVYLNKDQTDQWGIPLLETDVGYTENDDNMAADMKNTAAEMFDAAGFKNITTWDGNNPPGQDIHEMGGARMGRDPKDSILNGFNQMHAVKNVFVSDGACMTSSACQNPSLTYMAITARAANYAADELKKGNL
ncbi:MAG: GMC family oxidoreductase, partial [Balneolales bacterium]